MDKHCLTCDRQGIRKEKRVCENCIRKPFVEAYPRSISKTFKDHWAHATDYDAQMKDRQTEMREE